MFHNFFFLKRFADALNDQLSRTCLLECFSQNKNELIIGFATQAKEIWLRVNLEPQICLIQFIEDFKRAKKNSVNLFGTLVDQRVKSVSAFQYERSFSIEFENDLRLIFKMHGSRSNLMISNKESILEIFRNHLPADLELSPAELNKNHSLDIESFKNVEGNLQSFLPALGKEVKKYTLEKGYSEKNIDEKWRLFNETIIKLETNPIYVYNSGKKPELSLLKPEGLLLLETRNPLDAANLLYKEFTSYYYLNTAKSSASKSLESQIKKTENYLKKTRQKLDDLKNRRSYEELANIIMANLHQIKPRSTSVTLDDFYTNEPITIKLNPEYTPQKCAESLYRKSKNQKIEAQNLSSNLASREKQLRQLKDELETVRETEDFRQLKKNVGESSKPEEALPYHKIEFSGYQILIGKHAKSNDHLTLKVANKDDYWLHAKDVSGSHVVIRHKAGQSLPKDVLERASELAAWYSKRKNDTLCPVIFTQKKYVRKVKGTPAGMVRVEREEVIMVQPKPM